MGRPWRRPLSAPRGRRPARAPPAVARRLRVPRAGGFGPGPGRGRLDRHPVAAAAGLAGDADPAAMGPRALAFVPVLVGSLCGAAAVLACWGSVHLVALVFGSTVVGVPRTTACSTFAAPTSAAVGCAAAARPGAGPVGDGVVDLGAGLRHPVLPAHPGAEAGGGLRRGRAGHGLAGVLLWYPALLERMRPVDAVRWTRASQWAQRWPRVGRERWLPWALGALALAALPGLARLRADDDLRLLYAHDAGLEAEQREVTRSAGWAAPRASSWCRPRPAGAVGARGGLLEALDAASPRGAGRGWPARCRRNGANARTGRPWRRPCSAGPTWPAGCSAACRPQG